MTVSINNMMLNEGRNVTLTCMLQSVGGEFVKIERRPAILILPGGGYSMCSDREAEVVTYPYLQAGYHAFVLRYSVGEHRMWPNPLNDYEQAMELIRDKADEWYIDANRVAVIGFSAGGHLAACAATVARNRPNAAILGYAALEKDIALACQPGTDIPSPTEHVDRLTPPCFLFAARDDAIVPIQNTINFQNALIREGIMFESHIYAYGGHGFGTADACIIGTDICRRVPNWVRDSIGWLEDIFGKLTPGGFGKPSCSKKINGDSEDTFSIDCTYGYLKKQNQLDEILREVHTLVDAIIQMRFNGSAVVREVINGYKLRELMVTAGLNQEAMDHIEDQLRNIPKALNLK